MLIYIYPIKIYFAVHYKQYLLQYLLSKSSFSKNLLTDCINFVLKLYVTLDWFYAWL